MKVDPVKFPDK